MSRCRECGRPVVELRVLCAPCARASVGVPPPPRALRRGRKAAAPANRGPVDLRDARAMSLEETRHRWDEIAAYYEHLHAWQQDIVRATVEARTDAIRREKIERGEPQEYVEPDELRELRAVVNRVGFAGLNTTERRAYWRLIRRKSDHGASA